MNGLKNYKIMGVVMMVVIGLAIEGLRHFQLQTQTQDEIGRAGNLYAATHETSTLLHQKTLRRPRAEQIKKIQKINAPRGVKFDLKAAIKDYQKEHGLELTKDGARKRPDKLKAGAKKAKKKKNSKYEYVFDMKRGRWVKRLKLTPEQREALLAKKQAEMLEKMKNEKEKYAREDTGSTDSNNRQVLRGQSQPTDTQETATADSSKKEKNNLKPYAYWKPLLLNGQPNPSAIDELIKAYQAQPPQVTTEDFYKIAEELTGQQSLQMKEEGLLLVNTFPSHYSFRILAHMVYAETDSALSEKIHTIMTEDYTTIDSLHVLSKVLNPSEDTEVLLAATQQLNLTMEKVLSGGGDPASYASNFTDFVTLLQELSQQGGEVSTQATRTLALLQSRFNIQTVASNTPESL